MKAKVYDANGEVKGEITLPKVFETAIREDVVSKALRSVSTRQPYGSDIYAGKKYSASGIWRHARRAYKTLYGFGISRVPRKIMSRRGLRFNRRGATIPGTVGGREAHPPKAGKVWIGKVNKKEKIMALNSLIAATASEEVLKQRYPKTDFSKINLPLIIDEKITEIEKTKKMLEVLAKILGNSKGIIKKRVLLVTGKPMKVTHSAIESANAEELNIQKLAPSGKPGRFVIYTDEAIAKLEKR